MKKSQKAKKQKGQKAKRPKSQKDKKTKKTKERVFIAISRQLCTLAMFFLLAFSSQKVAEVITSVIVGKNSPNNQ